MEPLWSPVVAIGGNWSQMRSLRNCANKPKTVAVGRDRLRRETHGKERVSHRLPPVAEVPLSEREEVDFLKNAKSCEPEGPQDLTA